MLDGELDRDQDRGPEGGDRDRVAASGDEGDQQGQAGRAGLDAVWSQSSEGS